MYQFFSDPGHGWLRVPREEVVGKDVYVSKYSYQDDKYIYLEEDCDAWNWMTFAGVDNTQVSVADQDGGFIRNLDYFYQEGTKYTW